MDEPDCHRGLHDLDLAAQNRMKLLVSGNRLVKAVAS